MKSTYTAPAHKITNDGLRTALDDLGRACDTLAEALGRVTVANEEASRAHGAILGAVAELLACTGPAGGAAMARAFACAEAAGFTVQFSARSLTVTRNKHHAGQTL